MSGGRQGGWPPQQPHQNIGDQGASSYSNDFNNPAAFSVMSSSQQAAAAAAAAAQAARYHQMGGQQQNSMAYQHQTGANPVQHLQNNFYPGFSPSAVVPPQANRAQLSPTQQGRTHAQPQAAFNQHQQQQNANSYMSFDSSLSNDGNSNPYGNAWVSTVPSTFTPPDGSAFVKSAQYQGRDGSNSNAGAYPVMSGNGGLVGGPTQNVGYRVFPQQQQQQQQLHQPTMRNERQEEGDEDGDEQEEAGDGEAGGKKKGQKGASEFVKKLFRMLDDTSYANIVSWGPTGDSFIVRDMNDFTKHVLPRHFRHSNFASFVRQLNKYDFHKVKKPEEQGQPQQLGVDQQWEFRHPAFLQGREDMLEHVKRKVPTGKKVGQQKNDESPRDGSPSMPGIVEAGERGAQEYSQLKDQVATLTASQDQMTNHINNLTKQYQSVIGEMLTFQKNMVQQDQLMQNLIQYLMNLEADRKIEASSSSSSAAPAIADHSRPQLESSAGAFVSNSDAEKLVSSFSDVAKESFSQMSMISQRAYKNGPGTPHSHPSSTPNTATTSHLPRYSEDEGLSPRSSHATPATVKSPTDKGKDREGSANAQPSIFLHPPHFEADHSSNDILNAAANAVDNPTLAGFEGAGLRVFTVGTLQPRSEGAMADPSALQSALSKDPPSAKGADETNRPFGISVPSLEQLPAKMPKVDGRTTSANPTPAPGDEPSTPSEGGSNMLRVRRSTYVPGWAVPPKVLVVDDDDVCRKLGSKFLQVFGCAIDVAVDGVTAVNKMNLEKYDLVLMDIVMPNLDGVSATSLIREFDARTPIISMTSNSGPQELLSYMSSGMNDVLPKPFTKEGLLNMLEKHLIHLKTVQKMDEIPKALGLPPLSEDVMQDVLSATAASAQTFGSSSRAGSAGDGANPMAALMGHGPAMVRASQEAGSSKENATTNGGFDEDENLVNPLAGMGFSDEEYISMLQNLIAAGAVSDSVRGENADSVANVMGVARGEGMTASSGTRSKEGTPQMARGGIMLPPASKKRTAEQQSSGGTIEPLDPKKSRFTELSVLH